MEPKTPPSTPVSDSCCPPCQEITVTKQLGQTQKDAHGTYKDTMEAHTWWLQRTANLIRSERNSETEQLHRDHARANNLHEELERAILIHDISTSTAPVREKLAQNLVFLYLNLEDDYRPNCFETYQEMLLESLQLSLLFPVPPKRTKRDETQITSLVRALLELSGGRVDCRQHRFAEEYTASENADLYASVFNIVRTKQFGDFDSEEMCNTLSKSPVFSRMKISVQDLEEWTTKMMDSLRLSFREGHLNLPSQVLSGFGFGQVDMFRAYLAKTFLTLPALSKPENNVSLLLAWSTMVSSRQLEVISDWASSADGWNLYKQLVKDFQGPQSVEQLALTMTALVNYRRLLPDLLDHPDHPIKSIYLADLDALLHSGSHGHLGRVMEQTVFALIRVLHSFVDQFKDLIEFLETALDREPPLVFVFDGSPDQYLHLRIKVQSHETTIAELSRINMPKPRGDDDADWVNVTHPEELSLQGLHVGDHSQRPSSNHTLLNTKADSTEQSQVDDLLQVDIAHTIEVFGTNMMPSQIVASSSSGDEGYLSPPPGSRADLYALIRLSKVEDRNILKTLDTKMGTVNELPSIEELTDGSLEICILKSHRRTIQNTVRTMFSDLDVELYYDPLEPTANDLKFWDYETAKKLYQCRFFQRATRVIKMGWPAAAACYASLLHEMFEPRLSHLEI